MQRGRSRWPEDIEAHGFAGLALPSLVKEVSQRRIDVYSGLKPRSIHSDEAWAHQKGFRACLAQGMMSTAYVSRGEKTAVGHASGLVR